MPKESQRQGRFFGLVRSVQKGQTPRRAVSEKVRKAAQSMSAQQVTDFAQGPQKGLPEKVRKRK